MKKEDRPKTKVKKPEPSDYNTNDWIIWAAWADRITFEEIYEKTNKTESDVIKIINSTELPAASETLYVNVYVPGVEASTEPEVVIELDMSPSTSSEAEAPASVYESPSSILIVEEPTRVIVGAPVSGTITSGIGSSSLIRL